jgi:hypothetical protein
MCLAVILYASQWYWKQPYHTSALSGAAWVEELVYGHPERIRNCLGMRVHVFLAFVLELRLCGLRDSRYVSLREKTAIFLYTCVTGLSVRHVGERFQRSNDTISKLRKLFKFCSFSSLTIASDTSKRFFLQRHHHNFIINMFNFHQSMIQFRLQYLTTPNFFLFLLEL